MNSAFVKQPVWLIIGKYKINVSRISAGRVLDNLDKYNLFTKKKFSSEKQAMEEVIDIAINMLRIDFSLKNFFDWLTRKLITKKYVLKVCDIEELNSFIENCFEPIVGSKKKVQDKNKRLTELGLRIAEKMPEEELIGLLSKYQSSPDGQ